MAKKHPYKLKDKQTSELKEPQNAQAQKKRFEFTAHATFEEMNEAKRKAFMKLSMGERFLKGLELYQMFKDENNKAADPKSYILKKRKNATN